jgi:Asp-tRNA(Asn)/Glu-tRNA(Gln) amidotransferase A subunit family amidase
MDDISFVMKELVPRASLWAEDCVAGEWADTQGKLKGSGPNGELVIGVLRCDGNCTPLPPVEQVLSEVASSLQRYPNIKVVEVPTPKAWAESQSLMAQLINFEGGALMGNLVTSMQEPLLPWIQARIKPSEPYQLEEVARLQARRSELELEMLQIWSELDEYGRRNRKIDAVICPVAPHPVPEIDRWDSLGYTNSFVLFDYPAGTLPVRYVVENDLQLGKPLDSQTLGTLDDACRELWDEKTVDRNVYVGTPLSMQVVVPRLEDERLGRIMTLIDGVVQETRLGSPNSGMTS